MIYVFLLLFFCFLITQPLPKTASAWKGMKNDSNGAFYKIIYAILIVTLVLFSGLRTKMNDTASYLNSYEKISSNFGAIFEIDFNLGKNPGFEAYRIILRSLGLNKYIFLLITSIFVTTSFIVFLRKYSADFSFTIYLFIASTTYGFTMAAMKQTIATAIGIWAISALLNKRYFSFVALLLLACTFHPYILIYLIAPIFVKKVWSKRTVVAIIIAIVAGLAFSSTLERLISITSSFGDIYDIELFEGNVNFFRLAVYLVVPLLSFIFRKRLREINKKEINLIVNLSIISACFMIIASFGGANMFGRMANYFDVFNCLALPIILYYCIDNDYGALVKMLAIVCYAVFYYTYYSKYGTAWTMDYYNHISLIECLFGGK